MKLLLGITVGALGALVFMVACGGSSTSGKPPLEPTNDNVPGLESDSTAGDDGGADPTESASGDAAPASSSASAATVQQGDQEGAQALLKQFVAPNADHAALTKQLRPTKADYKSLFDAQTAAKVEAAQAKDWDSDRAIIKPKPNQTEVKLWSASGSDIASWKGGAKEFPGGYKKLGKHLAPSVLFYRFKFVEAGKDTGTAYDGLAFVNSHWVIAPKPWKAIDGGKDDGDGDAPAKPTGKKPKSKKK